jgi:hypothetical protein
MGAGGIVLPELQVGAPYGAERLGNCSGMLVTVGVIVRRCDYARSLWHLLHFLANPFELPGGWACLQSTYPHETLGTPIYP